ncbi:MAG: hypothetical protein HC831_05840 [Chloroflexia bacterium]|nr:hypothetical protein [Chloroflexia bacterium]
MKVFISIYFILFNVVVFSQEKTGNKLSGSKLTPSKTREAVRFHKERKMLRDLIKEMENKDFYALNFANWSPSYKNNTNNGFSTSDSIFIDLPKNHPWQGKEVTHRAPSKEVYLHEILATEVVVKQKVTSTLKPDIKIVQFVFENEEKAKNALPKMKKISAYTISVDGLKSPNGYWIYKNMIYFCRVRAAAFSIKPFQDTFEKTGTNNSFKMVLK